LGQGVVAFVTLIRRQIAVADIRAASIVALFGTVVALATLAMSGYFERYSASMYARYVTKARAQSEQSQHAPARVVFLGDSHIANSHVEQLSADYANYGIGGDTIDGLIVRLPSYDLSHARTIVLEIGTNNIEKNKPPYRIGERYERLLKALPPSARVIAVGVPPVRHRFSLLRGRDTDRDRANAEIRNVCRRSHRCSFVDPSFLADESGVLRGDYDRGDGGHLSAEGYRVLLAKVNRRIASSLETD
jgi:lysophospholipase L1-like esterase